MEQKIQLDRNKYPHSYVFHFVTVVLKDGKKISCQTLIWDPKDRDGEYLVQINERNESSHKTVRERIKLKYQDATVYVNDESKKFIFETCQANNWEHVTGEDAVHNVIAPIPHATLYDKNFNLIAKDVQVAGWSEVQGSTRVLKLGYVKDNKPYTDGKLFIKTSTKVDLDVFIFANERDIFWDTRD